MAKKKATSPAVAMNAIRWAKVTDRTAETAKAVAAAAKARKKKPKAERTRLAKEAAAAITPDAAKSRALKAWETKRRKKAEAEGRATD